MNLSSLSSDQLEAKLVTGLSLSTGPFVIRIRSRIPSVIESLATLYADYELHDDGFADFAVTLRAPRSARRWYRPQVLFFLDDRAPFTPLPYDQAFPLFEWGCNWCIAMHAHQYLIIHAAVVEKNGNAIIMPGPPGAGKSTLCAALVGAGWRLLSDELTLVSLSDGKIYPVVRPISLKNASISIIRERIADVVMTKESWDTVKGAVTLMKAPRASVQRMAETARARWVIVPRYGETASNECIARSRAATCTELAQNAFNYGVLGELGFDAVADLINLCDCYDLSYSDLDLAIAAVAALDDSL